MDLSRALLRRARRNVPEAHLIRADLRSVRFRPASFRAVVAWDSVFHVPRAEHETIYGHCFRWLEPGGRMLLSTGGSAWEGTPEMFGHEFFFSGWAPDRTRTILERIGFRVERWDVDDPSSRGHVAGVVSKPSLPGAPPTESLLPGAFRANV